MQRSGSDDLASLEKLFLDPLSSIEPKQANSLTDALSIMDLLEDNLNNKSDWEIRNKALIAAMSYLKGGISNFQGCDFSNLSIGISECVTDNRSTLVKSSTLLIAACAQKLGTSYASSSDIVIQSLFKKLSNGTAFISNACRLALREIYRNVIHRRVLRAFLAAQKSKSSASRAVVIKAIRHIIGKWPTKIISSLTNDISNAIKELQEDPSQDVRRIAKLIDVKAIEQALQSSSTPSASPTTSTNSFNDDFNSSGKKEKKNNVSLIPSPRIKSILKKSTKGRSLSPLPQKYYLKQTKIPILHNNLSDTSELSDADDEDDSDSPFDFEQVQRKNVHFTKHKNPKKYMTPQKQLNKSKPPPAKAYTPTKSKVPYRRRKVTKKTLPSESSSDSDDGLDLPNEELLFQQTKPLPINLETDSTSTSEDKEFWENGNKKKSAKENSNEPESSEKSTSDDEYPVYQRKIMTQPQILNKKQQKTKQASDEKAENKANKDSKNSRKQKQASKQNIFTPQKPQYTILSDDDGLQIEDLMPPSSLETTQEFMVILRSIIEDDQIDKLSGLEEPLSFSIIIGSKYISQLDLWKDIIEYLVTKFSTDFYPQMLELLSAFSVDEWLVSLAINIYGLEKIAVECSTSNPSFTNDSILFFVGAKDIAKEQNYKPSEQVLEYIIKISDEATDEQKEILQQYYINQNDEQSQEEESVVENEKQEEEEERVVENSEPSTTTDDNSSHEQEHSINENENENKNEEEEEEEEAANREEEEQENNANNDNNGYTPYNYYQEEQISDHTNEVDEEEEEEVEKPQIPEKNINFEEEEEQDEIKKLIKDIKKSISNNTWNENEEKFLDRLFDIPSDKLDSFEDGFCALFEEIIGEENEDNILNFVSFLNNFLPQTQGLTLSLFVDLVLTLYCCIEQNKQNKQIKVQIIKLFSFLLCDETVFDASISIIQSLIQKEDLESLKIQIIVESISYFFAQDEENNKEIRATLLNKYTNSLSLNLIPLLNSSVTSVRRNIVQIFAVLKKEANDQFDQYFNSLKPSQQKLVEMYANR